MSNMTDRDADAFASMLRAEWMEVTLARLEQMLAQQEQEDVNGPALERKALDADEVKQVNLANGTVTGYASVYALDLGNDAIVPGAYKATLAEARAFARAHKTNALLPVLWMHDKHDPIGYISEAYEDGKGLRCRFHINPNIEHGRQALAGLKSGVLSFSIGFRPAQIAWKGSTRILQQIKLHEVSIVTFPMNLEARAIADDDEDEDEGGPV